MIAKAGRKRQDDGGNFSERRCVPFGAAGTFPQWACSRSRVWRGAPLSGAAAIHMRGGVPASGEICGPETESGRHSQGQDVPELRRDRPRPDSDMPAPSVAPLCSDMFGALPGVSSSSCFSGDRCPGAGAYVSVLPRSMRISSCVNTADVFHSLFIRLSLTGGKMRRGGVEFRPVP